MNVKTIQGVYAVYYHGYTFSEAHLKEIVNNPQFSAILNKAKAITMLNKIIIHKELKRKCK